MTPGVRNQQQGAINCSVVGCRGLLNNTTNNTMHDEISHHLLRLQIANDTFVCSASGSDILQRIRQ